MTEGLTLTEAGFVYVAPDSTISIVSSKKILRGGITFTYEIRQKGSRIGQTFDSKKLPFEADPKRDDNIISILGRHAFTEEQAKNIISGMIEAFNSLPPEKLQELKTIPEKETEETRKPTIEERYGAATYSLARKILADPHSFQIARHVLDFDIAGEYQKKMLIFALVLTAFLGRPTWVIVAGKQAEGKSRLTEKIYELLPENIKERMNSGKLAAIYRKSLENPYYYDRKVIYFGDLGDMDQDLSKSASAELREVFSIFKQLSTDGEVSRTITIKNDTTGEWESINLVLRGRPLLMFTTTATEFEPQIESRAFIIYPSMGKFQNDVVALYQKVENLLPASQLYPQEFKELKKSITCALEILWNKKKEVLNPYTLALDAGISKDSPNIKRDRPKVFSIVNSIALWHSGQRDEHEGYIIADIKDNLYALHIAGQTINHMLSGGGDENFVRQFEKLKEKIQPLSRPLAELKADTKSKEKEERVQAEVDLEEKAITNDIVQDWLGIGTSSAAALTRQAAKKGLLVADKSSRQYKYYLPAEASRLNVKTNGHVAFDCNATLQALFNRTELCNALDRLCSEGLQKYVRQHTDALESLPKIKTPDYRLPSSYKVGDVCVLSPLWDMQLQGQSGVFPTFSYLKEQLNAALQHNATSPASDLENCMGKKQMAQSDKIKLSKVSTFEPSEPSEPCNLSMGSELSARKDAKQELCGICNTPLKSGEGERGPAGMGLIHSACKYQPFVIVILQDIPPFMGVDLRRYGPFGAGEIATVPAINALALIKRGAAKRSE